jgi:hypothetical protein
MKMPITIAPILLAAVFAISIALADRMKERASYDRFSFDDSNATGLLVE